MLLSLPGVGVCRQELWIYCPRWHCYQRLHGLLEGPGKGLTVFYTSCLLSFGVITWCKCIVAVDVCKHCDLEEKALLWRFAAMHVFLWITSKIEIMLCLCLLFMFTFFIFSGLHAWEIHLCGKSCCGIIPDNNMMLNMQHGQYMMWSQHLLTPWYYCDVLTDLLQHIP